MTLIGTNQQLTTTQEIYWRNKQQLGRTAWIISEIIRTSHSFIGMDEYQGQSPDEGYQSEVSSLTDSKESQIGSEHTFVDTEGNQGEHASPPPDYSNGRTLEEIIQDLPPPPIPKPMLLKDNPRLSERERRLLTQLCDIPEIAIQVEILTADQNTIVHLLHRML